MSKLLRERKGSVLIYSIVLMMVLVVTAGAFMKWAADEAYQANLDLARTQAYYIAQKGAIERGLGFLRQAHTLETGDTQLEDGQEHQYGHFRGKYVDARVLRLGRYLYGDENAEVIQSRAWDVTATGVVELPRPDGTVAEVSHRFTLRSQLRTWADFMYLSDVETALPPDSSGAEVIWFYSGDTLYGRVHSNDFIGIKQRPVFYAPVSTAQEELIEGPGYNPYFEYPPKFNVPGVYFPETAQEIRDGASVGGGYIPNNDGQYLTQIVGNENGWEWVQWPVGTGVVPTPDNIEYSGFVPYSLHTVVFAEGRLYIKGESVQLKNMIACEGNMYLIDNVKYADVGYPNPTIPEDSQNILGLLSEKNIVIRDSEPNGKGNGGQYGDHDDAHIVITAGLIALGESFTFEHQNDSENHDGVTPQPAPWDHGNYLYQAEDPPVGTCDEDERGYIYLRGVLAQKRRGYVHRSNCGGTGYWKSYDYDFRLQTDPPPLYMAVKDKNGNMFFDVTTSWDSAPN